MLDKFFIFDFNYYCEIKNILHIRLGSGPKRLLKRFSAIL